MEWTEKWVKVKDLGEGGQGIVYQVLDSKELLNHKDTILNNQSRRNRTDARTPEYQQLVDEYLNSFGSLVNIYNPSNHLALKVLHKPEDARNAENAVDRMHNEISAMKEIEHPNLLKIYEHDDEFKWYVSEFHRKGSLDIHPNMFKGDAIKALSNVRPLVDGAAKLHDKEYVHRDIKTQNVFVDHDTNLILGDFGLVYRREDNKTRISGKFENVGDWRWMPEWAADRRMEDLNPTFDVFSLGKLLWAMITGKPYHRLWYYKRGDNNLEDQFPKSPEMKYVNELLSKCIVEEEKDCLPNADALLNEIEETIISIESRFEVLRDNMNRRCLVCGDGKYIQKASGQDGTGSFTNYGIHRDHPKHKFNVFECSNCGHIQFFHWWDNEVPLAWKYLK